MAFIISKTSLRDGNRRSLYYVVENYRVGKKVKRRTLLCLKEKGNPYEALQQLKAQQLKLSSELETCKKSLEQLLKNENQPFFYMLKRQLTSAIEQKPKLIAECQLKIEILEKVVPKTMYKN